MPAPIIQFPGPVSNTVQANGLSVTSTGPQGRTFVKNGAYYTLEEMIDKRVKEAVDKAMAEWALANPNKLNINV